MKVKPIKIKIKEPTPSAADRLYAKHQAIRKAKGLPDPSEYKKKLDTMKKEEVEQLDELSPATKASYVSKAKEQIKQSEPWTKKGEYRDIAKNFIEKRKKGIAKVTEQHVEGRFKPVKPRNVKSAGTASPRPTSDSANVRLKESVTVGRAVGRGNIYQYDRNPPPKDGSELENIPFNAKTEQQKRMKKALTDLANKLKKTDPKLREDVEQLDEKKKLPGLWANIHAKRKRGEPPAKPGDKDYPKTLNIESADDDLRADQITTDSKKFPKKMSRKAKIVKGIAKGNPDQFQSNPILDSDVNPQTNKQ